MLYGYLLNRVRIGQIPMLAESACIKTPEPCMKWTIEGFDFASSATLGKGPRMDKRTIT